MGREGPMGREGRLRRAGHAAALLASLVVILACGLAPWGHGSPPGKEVFDVAVGADGTLWFAELDWSAGSGRYTPRVGRLIPGGRPEEFALPAVGQPTHITVTAAGELWYTSPVYPHAVVGQVTSDGHVTEYPEPGTDLGVLAGPLAADRDGAVWVAGTRALGKLTAEGALAAVYPLPALPPGVPGDANTPTKLVAGPDGTLWFIYLERTVIGRMTPHGTITEVPLPDSAPIATPSGLAVGPDGTVWYVEKNIGRVGRVMPDGSVSEHMLQDGHGRALSPLVIAAGHDGAVWFGATQRTPGTPGTLPTQAYYVGRLNGGDGTIAGLYAVAAQPRALAVGADGALWFATTSSPTRQIGRVSPAGEVTYTSLP